MVYSPHSGAYYATRAASNLAAQAMGDERWLS